MRNISPSNRKPSAAGSGYRTEDLGVTCRYPQPLSHSGYPSGFLSLILQLERLIGELGKDARVLVRATRDLIAGEEMFADYGEGFTFEDSVCLCHKCDHLVV